MNEYEKAIERYERNRKPELSTKAYRRDPAALLEEKQEKLASVSLVGRRVLTPRGLECRVIAERDDRLDLRYVDDPEGEGVMLKRKLVSLI